MKQSPEEDLTRWTKGHRKREAKQSAQLRAENKQVQEEVRVKDRCPEEWGIRKEQVSVYR